MTKTEKELEVLLEPVVQQLGYELYDVEFVKEGTEWFLRLYIDSKEKNIDLEDCEKVSNFVGDLLDEKDPISTAYNLEVSSCGLERHMREEKHYEAAKGKKAELKLFTPLDGSKSYIGIIQKVSPKSITILAEDGTEKEIAIANIASAKTLFDWEE